jgi:hypothetical protein
MPAAGSLLFYFCRRLPRVILLVFVLVAATDRSRFSARARKLTQHRADRIDHWLDPKKAMPIKGGAQA